MSSEISTMHGRTPRGRIGIFLAMMCALLMGAVSFPAAAQEGNALTDIGYASLPGNRVQVKLTLSQPAPDPLAFTIDNPARIALDFQGVANSLQRKNQNIGIGAAASISAVEAKGRTRVVLNLVKLVPYQTRVEGNEVFITLESPAGAVADAPVATPKDHAITNIDFRRGKKGEGRVIVTLSDSGGIVDVGQEGSKLVVNFPETMLPESLVQRLDVVDFATPVNTIETGPRGGNVRMEVNTTGGMEHLAYQSENIFTLEVKPITKEEQKKAEKEKFGYTGEKLSLNFQNIEVRAVLQLIADFTGLNLVASDTVGGNVTLRLKNVPWDQALDIVLKTKGLDMRQMGNVILVAPAEEIAAREKQELEAAKQIIELEPLRTELIQVNYAKATDISNLLKAQESSLLTERGSVTVDERTNTLLVLETDRKLSEIRALVASLDIPIRQVLIESRIVIASDGFSKDLGVRFGFTQVNTKPNGATVVSGDIIATDDIVNAGNGREPTDALVGNRLNVNLPPASTAGGIGLAILGSDFLVDLELSAMQQEGNGEVISNPRVVTANQREATIEQGVEIPYQEASSSGATSVSFKKAVLSLKVKPQITPDDRVIMDLTINKDSVGDVYAGVPSIDTRQINTQVLVDNGETVVLGGIFEQTRNSNQTKVPFFGDLPVLGRLFRNDVNSNTKEELLVFITPKILKEVQGVR